jgi:hypothetical protein
MAKSFAEKLAKGEPIVVMIPNSKAVAKVFYREGDEKRALEALAEMGIIELEWILPGTKIVVENKKRV